MSTITPEAASEPTRMTGGYEIANVLGRMNADRPKLGDACVNEVPVAKAIKFMLSALDLHCREADLTPHQVAKMIRKGRIEIQFDGPFATVICR